MTRPRLVALLVVGSVVVHFVAACTASVSSSLAGPGGADAGVVDALLDALLDVSTPDAVAGGDAGVVDSGPVASPPVATSGTRLRARYQVTTSADGASSKVFNGWHDATLAVDCTFNLAEDGSTRCVPTGSTVQPASRSSTYFADPACTTPVVLGDSGCPAPAFLTLYSQPVACSSLAWSTFSLASGPVPASVYHLNSSGTCITGSTGGATSALVGTPIVAAQLQSGTVTTIVE